MGATSQPLPAPSRAAAQTSAAAAPRDHRFRRHRHAAGAHPVAGMECGPLYKLKQQDFFLQLKSLGSFCSITTGLPVMTSEHMTKSHLISLVDHALGQAHII